MSIPGIPGMSGPPSFDIQGGDAAPSSSDANQQHVNPWMSSPFSVGTGSSSSTATPVPGTSYSVPGVVLPGAVNAGNASQIAMIAAAGVVAAVWLKGR